MAFWLTEKDREFITISTDDCGHTRGYFRGHRAWDADIRLLALHSLPISTVQWAYERTTAPSLQRVFMLWTPAQILPRPADLPIPATDSSKTTHHCARCSSPHGGPRILGREAESLCVSFTPLYVFPLFPLQSLFSFPLFFRALLYKAHAGSASFTDILCTPVRLAHILPPLFTALPTPLKS